MFRILEIDHVVIRARDAARLVHFYCDVDAMRVHLEAHGARVGEFGWRYGADGEGPSLYIEDPEGNTVELKGPPSPRPVQQQGMPLSS